MPRGESPSRVDHRSDPPGWHGIRLSDREVRLGRIKLAQDMVTLLAKDAGPQTPSAVRLAIVAAQRAVERLDEVLKSAPWGHW
jgi:hypothetical protein